MGIVGWTFSLRRVGFFDGMHLTCPALPGNSLPVCVLCCTHLGLYCEAPGVWPIALVVAWTLSRAFIALETWL
jgi:hypothetical protein